MSASECVFTGFCDRGLSDQRIDHTRWWMRAVEFCAHTARYLFDPQANRAADASNRASASPVVDRNTSSVLTRRLRADRFTSAPQSEPVFAVDCRRRVRANRAYPPAGEYPQRCRF